MEEIKKVLDISITGFMKENVLSVFEKQLQEWQIVMPSTERIVLDFGLNDFHKTGLIECWIINEMKAGYCGKMLFVFDGQTCPRHSHRMKHETFYVIKGKVKMMYDDEEFEMNPGDVLPVPAEKVHSFTGIGPALLLEISTPCHLNDNYFENKRIPIGGNFTE